MVFVLLLIYWLLRLSSSKWLKLPALTVNRKFVAW